jgi:hypothetical protein
LYLLPAKDLLYIAQLLHIAAADILLFASFHTADMGSAPNPDTRTL